MRCAPVAAAEFTTTAIALGIVTFACVSCDVAAYAQCASPCDGNGCDGRCQWTNVSIDGALVVFAVGDLVRGGPRATR